VKRRDLGLNSKYVRHVARRCGNQDVVDTKPDRVKFRKQYICIPKTATEEYSDAAAKKSEATTRYTGPVGHT
jgi:hypothetical protein